MCGNVRAQFFKTSAYLKNAFHIISYKYTIYISFFNLLFFFIYIINRTIFFRKLNLYNFSTKYFLKRNYLSKFSIKKSPSANYFYQGNFYQNLINSKFSRLQFKISEYSTGLY